MPKARHEEYRALTYGAPVSSGALGEPSGIRSRGTPGGVGTRPRDERLRPTRPADGSSDCRTGTPAAWLTIPFLTSSTFPTETRLSTILRSDALPRSERRSLMMGRHAIKQIDETIDEKAVTYEVWVRPRLTH